MRYSHIFKPTHLENNNRSVVFRRKHEEIKICVQALEQLWDVPPSVIQSLDFHVMLKSYETEESYQLKIPDNLSYPTAVISVKYKHLWCNWRCYPSMGYYIHRKTENKKKLFIELAY